MENDPDLFDLLHDVNAKCTALKRAAANLRGGSSPEELKLLRLMSEQARVLADKVSAYESRRRGSAPPQ